MPYVNTYTIRNPHWVTGGVVTTYYANNAIQGYYSAVSGEVAMYLVNFYDGSPTVLVATQNDAVALIETHTRMRALAGLALVYEP